MEEITYDDYNSNIDTIRKDEYPMIKDTIYLDHAGMPLYPKSMVDQIAYDMTTNLFGNTHSESPSSQLTTLRVEHVRSRVLQYFEADPSEFDVVFVANATAAIKLVMDAFRDQDGTSQGCRGHNGFWYGYHRDSHTSLAGVREVANAGSTCFETDREVEEWLDDPTIVGFDGPEPGSPGLLRLFAAPAQSNLDGRRLPLHWYHRLKSSPHLVHRQTHSLLDAAALVSTAPLSLGNSAKAPDFVALSFYKIFGFPDLGGLIVRKTCGHLLRGRKYFGGGTVDMVVSSKESWHMKKVGAIHDQVEDGTLPIHSIVSLGIAMDVHQRLHGGPDKVSRHTSYLARELYLGLESMRHSNARRVCAVYTESTDQYDDRRRQGPVIAFNLRDSRGSWVPKSEVEKLAAVKKIHFRTGGICNPGGVGHHLNLRPWEMRRNFEAGQRCGDDHDVMFGKPTGVIRVSLGATSNLEDVRKFLDFIKEFYVQTSAERPFWDRTGCVSSAKMHVESLMVYPIKSCGGWKIPPDLPWEVREEGLAWDREWCLVDASSGLALSQKRYPKMALLRPSINLDEDLLEVAVQRTAGNTSHSLLKLVIPLRETLSDSVQAKLSCQASRVCGDAITAQAYTAKDVQAFFTAAIGVPCTLARFPSGGRGLQARYAKLHLGPPQSPQGKADKQPTSPPKRPILLSNESPILTISRSSLNQLNQGILARGGKAARAEVFRANIVLADSDAGSGSDSAYREDKWQLMRIGTEYFQDTAEKDPEPFVTLSKTRRANGRIYFGQHTTHIGQVEGLPFGRQQPTIKVGDSVTAFEKKYFTTDESGGEKMWDGASLLGTPSRRTGNHEKHGQSDSLLPDLTTVEPCPPSVLDSPSTESSVTA
ncbi:MAG: hypothetical protein M1825_000179 [Sarcosagium campestre]|nr:MAG: hypothetical protein M1825_000179 [Sarcosagium campestre]